MKIIINLLRVEFDHVTHSHKFLEDPKHFSYNTSTTEDILSVSALEDDPISSHESTDVQLFVSLDILEARSTYGVSAFKLPDPKPPHFSTWSLAHLLIV